MKIRVLSLCVLMLSVVLAPAAPLELQKGDHIAILGGTLPDRMQHSAYLDTLIHAAFADKDVSIRNLAAAADEVSTWHRAKGFGTRDEWLAKVKADVIFAFYGFNESFKGYEGIEAFKKEIDKFLKETKQANYGGKGAPRIVLVSPIAAEKQANADIAGPAQTNTNLENYTAAMREVAAANDVQFVDLFTVSKQLYEEAARRAARPNKLEGAEPLTFNGIHLTEDGDRVLAPWIFRGIFGKDASWSNAYEKLRAAVLARNDLWHSRYRTVDGYNVYGGRSGLAYQPGQNAFLQNQKNPEPPYVSNYQVMQQEMTQRDVMTANREARVWAVAKGGDLQVKDDNLPPVQKVASNLPLGGETFNKTPMSGMKVDPATGLVAFPSGEEVLKKIKTPPGVKVQLFADEKQFPELVNPVQMGFDTKGRLWISAWKNYPERTPTGKEGDKLLIFEDTDNDGRADKVTTFMDNLNCPTGFQFYKDGVLVMRSPDLLFARDTDGDGKADSVVRVLSGLDAADSHHETNSMCYEPGGAIYCSDGVFHRSQVETPQGPVRNTDGCIYRWEPRTAKFERYAAYGFANPHGRVFDYWGNDIITDATGNANYFGPGFSSFLSEGKHTNYEQFWKRPSRPCAGTTLLSSRHFPEEFNGNFLNANVISIHGLFRVKVSEEGSGLKGEDIAYDNNGQKLTTLLECDPAEVGTFRPSCLSTAPDGSLYFADWANAIIGHMQHHLRDPNRDQLHGRIYRVTYEGRPLLEVKKVDGQPIAALLELLKEPENDVRTRAKIELDKHPSAEVIAATQQWVKQFDPTKSEDAHHILEALWVHQWHNVVNLDLIKQVLTSPEPRARAQAVRVVCYQRDRIPAALALIKAAANDENARVRLEAVRAASFFSGKDVKEAYLVACEILKKPTDYYLDYCFKESTRQLQSLMKEPLVPADPEALTYVIEHMANPELARAPKTEPVLLAQIERKGFDAVARESAVTALAKLHQTDRVTELVAALGRLDEKGAGTVAEDLGRMLATTPPADLAKARAALAGLTEKAKQPGVRRIAWAGLALADANPQMTWAAAKRDNAKAGVIDALAVIPDPALRARFQPMLNDALKGPARAAALKALPLTGAEHAKANFAVLATAIADAKERAIAARALLQLPREAWDAQTAGPAAESILAYAKAVPANQRTQQDFVETVQAGLELAALLPPADATRLRKELRGLGVSVFVVKTVREQMRYDTPRLVVQAGKPFEVIFENVDVMPHNLVFVQPGTRQSVSESVQTNRPDQLDKKGRAYVPLADSRVLDATGLVEPGGKETLKLRAPTKEGEYEYVCTFPGHWPIMWGKLTVVKDVDAYLLANPQPKAAEATPAVDHSAHQHTASK